MIRRAHESDSPSILELWYEMSIYHQKIDAYFALSENSKEVYRQFLYSQLLSNDVAVFVYELNAKVVAYILVKMEYRPEVFKSRRTGFVQELSVAEGFQRRGVGQALLEKALMWFKEQGVREVSCHYSLQNSKSSEFWVKNGFQISTVTGTRYL